MRAEDRAEGARAARLNLDLARKLEKGPAALSAGFWILGAHHLAAGEFRAALAAFLTAKEHAVRAEDRLQAILLDGYLGLTLVKRGEAEDGEASLRKAIHALEADGSEDAAFYAGQLRTVFRVFAGESRWVSRRLECGPLVLDVHLSRTAHLFHVVDHLSAWDPHCRPQYRRRIPPTEEDEAALLRYARIRKRKGWGGGLEQTFYTTRDLDRALYEGTWSGNLSTEEVAVLRETILRFAERVDAMIDGRRDDLLGFVRGLDERRLTETAVVLARFCVVERLEVPCYPIASPGKRFGGGYNGGRLVIEVPRGQDPGAVLLHEVAHAFFEIRREEIEEVAAATDGLDVETLSEGLAYAFAGGLGAGEGFGDRAGGARTRNYALALRPALALSLESGTLADFLPEAAAIWRKLTEGESDHAGGK